MPALFQLLTLRRAIWKMSASSARLRCASCNRVFKSCLKSCIMEKISIQ
nr:MAG TPA: putative zinc-ribbon domain protein [Caudoviricetes sp.]DAR58669.1 MAG TPA: putative zinc-ribbon domain protein [Caudoviricetes sp.]